MTYHLWHRWIYWSVRGQQYRKCQFCGALQMFAISYGKKKPRWTW